MKFKEFKSAIESAYAEKFPDSLCRVRIGKFGRWSEIDIDCYLAANEKECNYGYLDNDPFHIGFTAYLPDNFNVDEDDLPENLALCARSKFYFIHPVVNKWLAYERREISYRKTTGTPEKLVNTFGKFIGKLHESLSEDVRNHALSDDHAALAARKVS